MVRGSVAVGMMGLDIMLLCSRLAQCDLGLKYCILAVSVLRTCSRNFVQDRFVTSSDF